MGLLLINGKSILRRLRTNGLRWRSSPLNCMIREDVKHTDDKVEFNVGKDRHAICHDCYTTQIAKFAQDWIKGLVRQLATSGR